MDSAFVSLSDVTYRYRRSRIDAVRGVTTTFSSEPTILIGRNGAGKSTLLRMMSGAMSPQSGTVQRTARCSLVPQWPVVVRGLSVIEQVRYAAWLKGVGKDDAVGLAAEALEAVNILDLAARRSTDLSGGQLARLGIACGLVGDVSVLLLDEPSSSLDPIARREVQRVLTSLAERDVPLIASSHTSADLGEPFKRVLVMDEGKVVHDGPMAEFLNGAYDHPVVRELALALRPQFGGRAT